MDKGHEPSYFKYDREDVGVCCRVAINVMIFFTVGVSSGRHWDDDDRPLKRTYVVEATDYGLQKMNELVNVQEPHLYQIGMTIQ
jgi:hypothetical protein